MNDTPYASSAWSGRKGHQWVLHQRRLDRMLADFGEAALNAASPRPGDRVLDVGCGAGTTTLALGRRVHPGGSVVGVDISPPLVQLARSRPTGGAQVEFVLDDASRAPFHPGGFDLVFSRFGVMFFDDPVAAFRHLRRALRPGGRLAFICWRAPDENDWISLPSRVAGHLVPTPPPGDPRAPGPCSLADRPHLEAVLRGAGFDSIEVAPLDRGVVFGRGATDAEAIDDALVMALEVGPMSRLLEDQPDEVRAGATSALRDALAERTADGAVVIGGAAWLVTAGAF